MSNSINSLSPTFRDYLLLKNLVTDTVVDNGLQSLLGGIGYPAPTETLPNAVQPSNSINDTGTIYQELNTILNTYQGNDDDYNQVEIILNQSTNSTIGNQGPYANSNELLNGQFLSNGVLTNSNSIRQGLTTKNAYVDIPKQSVINLNTQPVPTFQNLTSYIDENNNLSIGGPGKQAVDVLAGLVSGQGVGLNVTNGTLIANEDIRSTLLGRTLGATGVINDTPLGNIGGQQLLSHLGYNASFGLQQETLGKLNLNPLTLLQGKPLVSLNYSITAPKGKVGKILNFAANVLGGQSPVSLLEETSSIFTFSNKLEYIGQGNIERANEMIANSGMGQVQSLMDHMRANLIISNPNGTNLRQGYAPGYNDSRKSKGQETGDGINSNLYARDNGNGAIIDFLNGEDNSPITSGNYERSKQISDDGWDKSSFRKTDYNSQKYGAFLYKDAFGWQDSKFNKDSKTLAGTNEGVSTDLFLGLGDDKNRFKTLLSKTERLFNSGKMRTLISGHGIKEDGKTQINSSVSNVGNYTSKGSGVMNGNAVINGTDDGPENVFCRTWTTYDRYAQVGDLQKNRGLYDDKSSPYYRGNVSASVLDDNGFARIAPYKTDNLLSEGGYNKYEVTDNKKYMFSIENLAWNDNLFNLLPCEVGPGDSLSGKRGRIMWFPPYDINFSESTSASWDKHNFIGRGEPIYTYNNTERSGNLSWKIIIDHPNYLNFIGKSADEAIGGTFDDYVASFFAGCIPIPLEDVKVITTSEKDKTEVENAKQIPVEVFEPETPPPSFNVYFPNDVYDVDKYPLYENGLQNPGTDPILYKDNISGDTFGLSTYTEMCYQFTVKKKKTWSSVQCSNTPGVTQGSDGRLEPDRNNYGLNAIGSPSTTYKGVKLNEKQYPSWRDQQYGKDLQNYLLTKCKNCKVEVVGYASTVGTFGEDRNDKLSELRAENVKAWLIKNIITDPPFTERVSVVADGKGATESGGGKCPASPESRKKNYLKSKNDVYGCKVNRYVTVRFVVDENLKAEEKAKTEQQTPQVPTEINVPSIPISRFYTECSYFEKLQQDSPVVYNTIKEKIKYFQPAFHSTTPEGFNSRLTFLQQCMRQGPTLGASETNNPNNLAFGRPPVCILRIGDFYHTKIIIENLNFTFEPLVWDLNPEGVGVQPMICNVDMSFAFIGGSSLNGPINRLQNAVSFNYYANTEIYDPRPDTIEINEDGGKIVDGKSNISNVKPNIIPDAKEQTGLSPNKEPVKDQVKENEVVNSGEDTQPITPAETPGEVIKKYPEFDENSGTYTTKNAHKIKSILTLVIPKGTKVYTSDKQITSNFSLFDNYETYDDKRYITVSQVMNPNNKKTPNNIYYNKIEFNCKYKQFLVYETPLNIDYSDGVPLKNARIYTEANNSLSNVLSDIFCKGNKTKTLAEIKKFDNTK